MTIPPKKKELLAEAARQVDEITELFNWGELSDDERYKQVIGVWERTTDEVTKALIEKHGAIRKGEKPARDISVPKKDMYGRNVSKGSRTIMEAEVTTEEIYL